MLQLGIQLVQAASGDAMSMQGPSKTLDEWQLYFVNHFSVCLAQ